MGTGTEDYINEAWNMRVHCGLFNGCTVFEPRAPDARVTAYRWHIADPVVFKTSLKMQLERRGFLMNSAGEVVTPAGPRPDFWSSVSYWYQDSIAKPWCEFPSYRAARQSGNCTALASVVDQIKHSPDVELQVLPYNRATYSKTWFRVQNDHVGAWIEIPFEMTEAGRYSISLFQLLREDNGIWKVSLDGMPLYEAGRISDCGWLSCESGDSIAAGRGQ